MGWIYLLIAGIFEVGWPLGLKFAQDSEHKFWWILFAIITMALSGYFLFFAQKYIPIGTAYAVWTGIGTIGTFFLGIFLFQDIVTTLRILGVFLILAGVIILKLSH
ncbi:multidrug efflux SMR transporter [bacterium]|nr:multidrug efflux SMR transporter [bacterium]